MTKKNHTCSVCGTIYNHCDYCENVRSYMPWRSIVDTIDHYKIFVTIKDYNQKTINKNQARSQLATVDITGWNNFNPEIVNVLNDILAED